MPKYKPLIGIVGGIGAGKSTVATCLWYLGCCIINADQIVHEILDRPEIIRKVVALFGEQVRSASGRINRQILAGIVFEHQKNLNILNEIIHPLVLARCEKMIDEFQDDPAVQAVVLDMPLLLEVGWEKRCDALIFVDCSQQNRAKRGSKKGMVDKEQQKKREKFQISLDKKKKIAQYVVDNNSDETGLAKQVEKVLVAIRERR